MPNAESLVLDTLYRGVTDSDALETSLDLIREMFSCQGGAFVSFDARSPEISVTLTSGVFKEFGKQYLRDFVAIDPAPAAFARLQAGTATTTDRMFPREQLERDPFHNEFFQPIGLVETLGGTLFSGRARFALIGLQRGNDRPPFDETEIAALERLMPHLARSLQLRHAFRRLSAHNVAMQHAIDRLAAGVVLVEPDGTVLTINTAMSELARRGDGLAIDRLGHPLPTNLAARKRLQLLLADVAGGGAGGIVTIPRDGERRAYVALAAPLPAAFDPAAQSPDRHGAIILVHDPDGESPTDAELLAAGFGLTRGAARLLAAIAANDDLKSYAEREGITIHTARFHLRTALARTGARTQAELVRLAVRLLRDLGSRPKGP
jgi:DNA-binding CsgD family transcriptional regulator/GAF domain-containing protein